MQSPTVSTQRSECAKGPSEVAIPPNPDRRTIERLRISERGNGADVAGIAIAKKVLGKAATKEELRAKANSPEARAVSASLSERMETLSLDTIGELQSACRVSGPIHE